LQPDAGCSDLALECKAELRSLDLASHAVQNTREWQCNVEVAVRWQQNSLCVDRDHSVLGSVAPDCRAAVSPDLDHHEASAALRRGSDGESSIRGVAILTHQAFESSSFSCL
jgi:hypothetical protein